VIWEIWQLGFTRNRDAAVLEHKELVVVIAGPSKAIQIWCGDEEIVVLSGYHAHS